MKLGINSVLFGGYDMETAFRWTAACGYDGIELSAIDGMSEHLVIDRWQEVAPEIRIIGEGLRPRTPGHGAALHGSGENGGGHAGRGRDRHPDHQLRAGWIH